MARELKFILTLISIIFIQSTTASEQTSLFDEYVVLAPTVGPVLGRPSDNQRRFWLRGPILNEKSTDTKYYGVISIKKSDQPNWSKEELFPLNIFFDDDNSKTVKDYVGLIDKTLAPGKYEYRCGYFGANKELSLLTKFRWSAPTYTFNVRDPKTTNASLAFGSCRYFARFWCFYPWLYASDKIFEHIAQLKDDTDAFAVIGDYIYGDFYNRFFQSRSYPDFLDLYEKGMNTPYFKQVIATIPCFNVLDDHEVSNNFGVNYPETNPDIYRAGMKAYMTYQHMVTPGFKFSPEINHEGYQMMIGDVPAFMMNTRSNRSISPPQIIPSTEMNGVKNWLLQNYTKPYKVLFSSVPMFPDYTNNPGQSEDKWTAYMDQTMELLNFINDREIHGVIICTGDIHKSLYTQIASPKGVVITSVIASPFFSPWGHDDGPGSQMQSENPDVTEFVEGYKYISSSLVYHTDAYARLEFEPSNLLRIKLFDTAGNWINEHDPNFSGNIYMLPPYNHD